METCHHGILDIQTSTMQAEWFGYCYLLKSAGLYLQCLSKLILQTGILFGQLIHPKT